MGVSVPRTLLKCSATSAVSEPRLAGMVMSVSLPSSRRFVSDVSDPSDAWIVPVKPGFAYTWRSVSVVSPDTSGNAPDVSPAKSSRVMLCESRLLDNPRQASMPVQPSCIPEVAPHAVVVLNHGVPG